MFGATALKGQLDRILGEGNIKTNIKKLVGREKVNLPTLELHITNNLLKKSRQFINVCER